MNYELEQQIAKLLNPHLELAREAIVRLIETPRDSSYGDFAFPVFTLAKKMRMAPPKIAEKIYEEIKSQLPSNDIQSVNVVGAYLNFSISSEDLARNLLKEIFDQGERFPSLNIGNGENVVIDLSSPNIAKPFHVGHLRSTVVGSCLYRLYEKIGYNCIGINHLGDWGTQFGKLIVAYKKYGSENMFDTDPIYALLDLYIRFHKEAKQDSSLEDQAREEFKKLEHNDPEAVEIWKKCLHYSLEEYKRIYELLNATIDEYTGESFYNDKMEASLELLNKKNLTRRSQDALIVDMEEHNLGAALLKKSDDATLYLTRDLAAILYRNQTYQFAKILYVVGSAQALHFKQLFKLVELLGYDWHNSCQHIEFGWIKFGKEMMSTREGNIVFLNDVIERAQQMAKEIILEKNPEIDDIKNASMHIGIGAIIYADLNVKRTHDINFNWESALNFDGNTGPYLQYVHTRLASLERKYGKDISSDIDYSLLQEPEEKQLMMILYRFPQKLLQTEKENEPAVICGYLYELAQSLNSFYQKYRVISDNSELTKARMLLIHCIKVVMSEGLRILGIKPMERM